MSIGSLRLVAGAALAACLLAWPAAAQVTASIDPVSTACTWTFTKSSGAAQIIYCVNAHGNVVQFTAPAGVEHIRGGAAYTEGYALCSSTFGVHGYDFADAGESPWGASGVVSPATSSGIKIFRETADGRLRLEHAFKVDVAEGDVTITVKIINLTGEAIAGVRYKRGVDIDPAGNTSPFWQRTQDEVSAVDNATLRGLSLNAVSFTTAHGTSIAVNPPTLNCTLGATATNGSVGNRAAEIAYDLGTIGPLKSKTIKFVYRRQ